MKDPAEFADHPVMGLIRRLKTFRVDWGKISTKNDVRDVVDYEVGLDIEEQDLDHANVVSSLREKGLFDSGTRHAVLLDLDVPTHLIPSSTPGHSHLYIDVTVEHHRYMALLSALADAGIIEPGYAQVSIARGRSDLRLPWVEKGDPAPEVPKAPLPSPAPIDEFPQF